MKDTLNLLLFLFLVNMVYPQSNVEQFSEFPGLHPTFYNYAYSDGRLLLDHSTTNPLECANRGRIFAHFDNIIDYTQNYTYGDVYHTFQYEIYGSNNNFLTSTLIKVVDVDLSNYTQYSNYYSYSTGYFDLPEPYFVKYAYKPIIKKYFLIGYPDMMFYGLPTTYKDDNLLYDEERCKDNDNDKDTIPNGRDNCPNTYNPNQEDVDGDGIGDVCDNTNNNAKPNLTLSGFKVKVGTTTYDATATTNSTPIFKYGENHTFTLTIKNNDAGDAASSNYKLLVSEEAKYPSIGTKPVYEYRIGNAGAISANSEKTVTFSEYFYDYISSLNLENDKTYHMIVDIDHADNIDESNENTTDNVLYIPFKYSKPATGKIALKINSSGSTLDIDYEFTSDTNYLRLQNINYLQLNYSQTLYGLSPTVDVSYLYNGVYALYINNTFVKKIGLITGRTYTGGPLPYEP